MSSAALAVSNPRKFVASTYQAAFFDWIAYGAGNAILKAVAGSGKSTSIVRALEGIPETATVLILAFNAPITKEMREKIAAFGSDIGRAFRNVEASTFHSRGYRALLRRWGKDAKPEIDGGKVRKILKDRLSEAEVDMYGDFVCKLVGFAKGVGVGIPSLIPDANDFSIWRAIIATQEMWLDDENATEERAINIAIKALKASNWKAESEKWIDFDDQLYLPLLWNLRLFAHDWVLVDEAQDTNPVRRLFARRCLKSNGRFVAVGDPRQAIYGFCHPPGELVMTPRGFTPIERLKKGDTIITSDVSGEINGWTGNRKILETHKFYHTGVLLTVKAGGRKTTFTPHHKIPVRLDDSVEYYTYMMRRGGVYRVGYCKAATSTGGFMLQHRRRMEKADCAWILSAHKSKAEARLAEAHLLKRVKGTTLHNFDDTVVSNLPTDEREALKILAEHGRMADFPIVTSDGKQPRVAKNGAFITEACNLMNGMKAVFYSDEQIDLRKRGRGQQRFVWTPINITSKNYSGFVYGITVPPSPKYVHGNYKAKSVSLYFAGDGVLVHNTGASHDAMDLIAREFNTVELPLTVSYRCPKAVSRLAQTIVPYFEVAPGAIEGEVFDLPAKPPKGKPGAFDSLDCRDMVLCRQTAPLIALAFAFIAEGRGCFVLGKDIGAGLSNLVKKLRPKGVPNLIERLEAYYDKEAAKFAIKGEDAKAEALADRIACVKTVIDSLPEGRTVPDVLAKIESLFADGTGNGLLTLSTMHKAKGREARRVAIYRPELCPSKAAKSIEAYEQEMNLLYVAQTRAMETLIFAEGEYR